MSDGPVIQFGVPMIVKSTVYREVTALIDARDPNTALALARSGSAMSYLPGNVRGPSTDVVSLDENRKVYPIINIDTGDCYADSIDGSETQKIQPGSESGPAGA